MKPHQPWRIALWLSRFQLTVFFFKKMWVFWLERVFPSLVIVFWISLTVFGLFCYCHFVIRQTMVSVLQANLTSCRIGFVFSLFLQEQLFKNVLFCGGNGTAAANVLSSELWPWALIPAWQMERQSSLTEGSSRKSEVRSQKVEVGSWNRKSNQKSEVRSGKWEVRSLNMQHWVWTVRNQKSGVRTLSSLSWSLPFFTPYICLSIRQIPL